MSDHYRTISNIYLSKPEEESKIYFLCYPAGDLDRIVIASVSPDSRWEIEDYVLASKKQFQGSNAIRECARYGRELAAKYGKHFHPPEGKHDNILDFDDGDES